MNPVNAAQLYAQGRPGAGGMQMPQSTAMPVQGGTPVMQNGGQPYAPIARPIGMPAQPVAAQPMPVNGTAMRPVASQPTAAPAAANLMQNPNVQNFLRQRAGVSF